MQFPKTKLLIKHLLLLVLACGWVAWGQAQVNTVEFGKNRVQYKKFKWQYYQTNNFNTYFYDNGKPIADYVLQIAEKELPDIEKFTEYSLQRRANIVVYNNFDDLQQSNIGLNTDWQTSGGITKLVNNKMIVYYDADHEHLRRQVRQGIAKILVENILFGDDLGEFAANQALLDLPQWLVDGYVDYVAEDWSPELDDQLKSALLSGSYKNFYQLAYEKPLLAGHAFWYYMATKYKKENVTYFLYLARVYRNLNSASQRICKKKFKEVLKDFMNQFSDLYYKDIRGRRNFPKGTISIVEELKKGRDFIRFTANPIPRSQTYAVVEYIKGQYCVVLYENLSDRKVLLKTGIRMNENEVNPNYPLLAWDGKGSRLACLYPSEGKIKLFVYDLIARYKPVKIDLDQFEQVQSMQYMLDDNTLLFSAVRNGQSDIFVFKIDKESIEQVTNDVYADLDASFVAFPNKQGIIFASDRPSPDAPSSDTTVPTGRYNIFLADNYQKGKFRQISQLTNMKYGDARYPMQYNTQHFTFISDESGIFNRYAGYFSTERAGLDTIFVVGDELLRNPSDKELDSTLKSWGKNQPDSVYTFSITNDSSYVFPITNYQSGLKETKIAGNNGQVSEVRQEGNLKFLYKLKVDETALRRRNVNPRPTEYRRRTITEAHLAEGESLRNKMPEKKKEDKDVFESGFESDSSAPAEKTGNSSSTGPRMETSPLLKAKLFDYKLKFSADNFTAAFNNDILINRYEPYTGSLPVVLQSGGAFNGMLKASVFDLFEDIRFTGAIRLPLISGIGTGIGIGSGGGTNVFVPVNQSFFDGGGEWYGRVDYLKKRMDYSLIYYRKTEVGDVSGPGGAVYSGKQYSNLYQAVLKYPLDRVRSVRLMTGIRTDKVVVRGSYFDPNSLKAPNLNKQVYALSRLEYVYDNSIAKTTNIWNGLRYKVYMDLFSRIDNPDSTSAAFNKGRLTFNFGTDIRYYYPIYRNFIWAGRAAADFSWGDQKILYYLGGVDGWLFPKYNSDPNAAPKDPGYAYQTLAVSMRGFPQNVSNGNNAIILNSEFRFPVFSTLFNKPINNAFLRNFQLVQFFDLGSAWNGAYNKIARPSVVYSNSPDVTVLLKAGGIGPFVGSYGFGVRSTLLGYFLRLDAGWEMNTFFRGKPYLTFAMGLDF